MTNTLILYIIILSKKAKRGIFMKYCVNCGKELCDEAVVCVQCGSSVGNINAKNANDAPNSGFAVLGFLIPIVGLILYLVYQDSSPLKAKSAGKGALIGFIVSIVMGIIFGVIYGVLIGGMIGGALYY